MSKYSSLLKIRRALRLTLRIVGGLLIKGQNPASSEAAAELLLAALTIKN